MIFFKRGKTLLTLFLVFCVLVLCAGFVATAILHNRERDTVPDTQKLAHTLSIIRGSTPANPKVLKVLFYGQSITGSGWHKIVVEHWKQQYPNTTFVVENRALGGFPTQALVRATEQDVAAFYPDLIIFHAYGDHRAYEKILRIFRSRTAADIIVQTDHGDVLPDPYCSEGLHLTKPAGCAGHLWYHQRLWNDEMSYHKIPSLGKKYGIAVEHQHEWWRDYLLRTGTRPGDLLADEIHPNQRGKELIAQFFNQYFDGLVAQYNGQTAHDISEMQPTDAERSSGEETLRIDGTRVELVTGKPLDAWPTVTVDGQAPSSLDGCYINSRPSSVVTVPDWPALRRVALIHDHTAEDWTATLDNFSPDQKDFTFTVQGSKSGQQGSGRAGQPFTSSNGNLQIEPDDWMIQRAWEHTHIPLKGPFPVTWSVDYLCGGKPEIIDRGNGRMEYRYVLVNGLTDARHSITIKGTTDEFKDINRFTIYTPRLHELESVVG